MNGDIFTSSAKNNFNKQIIAINMQHTDFQARHNGSDQDLK